MKIQIIFQFKNELQSPPPSLPTEFLSIEGERIVDRTIVTLKKKKQQIPLSNTCDIEKIT